MRKHDGYPIFIGREKYINDDRFDIIHNRFAFLSNTVRQKEYF